ncbi:MAG: hypothetical protein V4703_03295, partial [Actinomycetota bacterium]
MRFIQDEGSPPGMGRVVDDATGLDRMVYDPELAEQLASGYAESSAQQETIANAPETPAATAPAVSPDSGLTP